MFILSNSYELKDIKNNIFTTVFDAQTQIMHYVSTGETSAFCIGSELYALKKAAMKKISDLKSDITCLTVHEMLLCAGTKAGGIYIFSEHRVAVRQFTDHLAEITDIVITPTKKVIASSRDGKVCVYDLVDGKKESEIQTRERSVQKLIVKDDLLVCFSKNILLYSLNDNKLIQTIEFGENIDNAVLLESGNILFINGNRGYILDMNTYEISKAKILHTKQVSDVQVYKNKIYTVSYDGHIKSFTEQLQCISDINMNVKLIGLSINNEVPTIATADGKILSITSTAETVVEQIKRKKTKPKYEEEAEYETVQSNKKRLTEIEQKLSNFEYKGALKMCMQNNDLSKTFAVLKSITEKRALMQVAKDADVELLCELLQLCYETMKINEFTPIIVELLIILTTKYADEIVNNERVKKIIEGISEELNETIAFEEALLKAVSFADSFEIKE